MKTYIPLRGILLSCFLLINFIARAQFLDGRRVNMCNTPPGCQELPICTLSDDCFRFDFYTPHDNGDGTSTLKFMITNFGESTFKRATFELPGQGAATKPAISPNFIFQNRFMHLVQNKFQDSLIAYDNIGPSAGLFSYGEFEVYYYVVQNADLNAPYGRKAQVTALAGNGSFQQPLHHGIVNFDFDVCQGVCPGPIANLFLFPPGDLCLNNPTPYVISAIPQPNATFNWAITNGTIISGNGTNSINIRPDSAAGTLRVSLVVTNQCSFAVASKLFSVVDCGQPCPTVINDICHKQDCCFDYLLNGTQVGAGPGEFRPDFTLTNICGQQVSSVSFSLPNLTPAQQAALNPFSSTFNYTTTVTSTLLTFTATTGDFNSPGEFDDFVYTLPASAVTAPGGNLATVTINTLSGTFGGSFSQTFDLLNNDPTCSRGPLPVQLTKFNGKATPEGIALNWQTATEKNNDRFEVERSQDGKHFEKIGSVKGSGNSNSLLEYNFLDKTQAKGLLYYRLNQVDLDGTATHSPIINVRTDNLAGTQDIVLIPNPCSGQNCSVELIGFRNTMVTIELSDLTGRTVFTQTIPGNQATLTLPKITGNGLYILSAKDGIHTAYQKIIIQE